MNLFLQNMTPLTVAAYLARMEMFFHIANIEREVYWQIGKTQPFQKLENSNFSSLQILTKTDFFL